MCTELEEEIRILKSYYGNYLRCSRDTPMEREGQAVFLQRMLPTLERSGFLGHSKFTGLVKYIPPPERLRWQWKITMNESMYLILNMRIFHASHVIFF